MNAISIPVRIGVENLESLKDARNEIKGLQDDVKTLRDINKNVSFEGQAAEYKTLLNITENNVNDLMRLYHNIDAAETTEDRDIAISQYQSAKNRAVTSIKSIGSELSGFVEMLSSFTEEQTKIFTNGLRKIRPQVAEAFNETARAMATTGTKGAEQLIKSFGNSNTFKQIWASLQREHPEIFTDQVGRQYLKNSFSSMVSKRYVNDYVDWNGKEINMPSTIKDRLPSLFRGLQLTQNPTRTKMNQNGIRLSDAEMSKFEKFIKKNTYLADEAEQAGLIRRSNGRIFINPNATREHVNAFGGNLVAMFEAGMRGGPGNGINDLENQKFTEKQYNSLLRKTNGSVDYAIHGAKFLQDSFDWIRPTYTKVQTSKNVQGWKDIGEYYSPNRQRSMGVYQFSPSDIGEDGKVKIAPQKTTAEGYMLPNREQYATMKYNMLFDKIENLPAATKKKLGISNFEHNGFNKDIILMNVPIEELEDPSTSPERKEEIAQQLNNVIKAKPKVGKRNFEFIGTTGTQVAFLRKEIKDAIEEQDKDFFYNGESRRGSFGSDAKAAHDAFRAYEYASKWATDVEPVQRVYGTNLKNAIVVGANLQDIAGMDGQNIGSKAFFPETFQSRGQRDKSTTQVIDLDKFFYNADAPYHNFVNEETGEIVLPNGGWNGGELRIPKGVALIQNKANVKIKHDLEGKTQEEINEFLTRNLRENGYFIKQSASAYHTPTRFISAQEAATMELGPEARSYFREIGLQRIAELDDPDTVKRILFSGNDYLSQLVKQDESYLSTQEVTDRINEEKKYIYQNMGQGRLMLPSGAGAYAMLSAWIPNVLNDLIGEENLDQTQKSLGLGKDAVAFFQSQDEILQMFRNPSTIEGNIEAINDAASKYTQGIADMLGLSEEDKKQLFVAPTASDFLKLMQGADLDSDTAFVRMAKHNTAFAQIMSQIMADTTRRYNLVKENGYTDEAMKDIEERYTKTLDTTGREFGLGNDYNLEHMRWFVNSFGKAGGMGAANAVSMYAAQYPMSERVSKALMASGPHYDKNSIFQQKAVEYWDMTPEEWSIISGGAPLYQLYRWAKDANREMTPQEKEDAILKNLPVQQVFDYDKFFKRNINHVNFTSMHDSHGLEAEYSMWAAARRNPTEFRNSIVDWENVFSHSSFTVDGHTYDPDSDVGKYLTEMNDWRTKKLNQEFLVFEDELADRLVAMEQNAVTQIWSDVAKEGFTGKNAIKEASARMSAIGISYDKNNHKAVGAAGHLKAWGLTRSNVSQNGVLAGEITQLANIYGEDAIFGGAGVEVPELVAKEIDLQQRRAEVQARHDAAVKRKEEEARKAKEVLAKKEADRKTAQEAKKEEQKTKEAESVVQPEVEVTTASTLPTQAQPVQQPQPTYKRQTGDHAFIGTGSRRDNKQPEAAPKTQEYLKAEAEEKATQKELNDIDATIRFNEMLMDMQNYEQSLQSKTSALVRENTGASEAQSYIAKTLGVSGAKIKGVMDFYKENMDSSTGRISGVDSETKALMDASIENIKDLAYQNIVEESKRYSGSIIDRLNEDIAKTSGKSKQRELLDKRQEEIAELAGWQGALVNTALDPRTPASKRQALLNRADQMPEEVAQAIDKYDVLVKDMTKTNEIVGKQSFEQLQIEQGLKSKNSLSVISSARKLKNEQLRSTIEQQHKEGIYSDEAYEDMMKGLAQLDKRANPAMIALGQGAKILKNELKSSAGYLTQMFTRRLFQTAISETTNFVKQFDASMNTIQMITLKTDEQINTLGDSLIDKAKEMKISVSEITQSAATLYRQGLNDQEVDERLGVISKFSKVSGTKVDAATKLITVAMNTGLVTQAEQAADIVTALGDNAATNAAEIEKGIEKAGAAAAADGTTFAQLSAMLTAITSTTQIGGNVAGRTLNTIFGRMNKIGTNELIYDENGNAVSGSAVAKLLEEEGIRMYDEYGNKRSSFNTLYALSQKWENLSDAKQQQFANAIAGTRQYSNFAAIMSGMAEGKVEEYLKLAGESEGITDRKYEIYTKSLNASLTDLKNTWDGLIHDMTDSGALTGGLGFLTNFIQGIDKANESLGGLGVTLAGILPSLMVMGGIKSGSLIGAGVAAAGLGIAAIVSAIGNQKSSEEQYQEIIDDINNKHSSRNEEIEKARTLFNKGDNRSKEEEEQYDRLLRNLSITVEAGDLDTVNRQTNEQRRQNAENIIQQASDKNELSRVREMIRNRNKTNKLIEDEINKAVKEDEESEANLGSQALQTLFAGKYNTETMNTLLSEGKGAPTYVQGQLLNLYNEVSSSEAFEKIKRDYNVSDEDLKSAFINSWNTGGWHTDFASGSATDALYTLMQDYWSHTYTPTAKRQTVAKENYIQYLSDMALPLDENEIEALAEDLTNRYLENGGNFFSYISDALGLSKDNYTVDSIAESARSRLKEIGYNKNEKTEKFESANLDYIQNGYYYDNKTGQYLTSEQAEAQIDRYNTQAVKTRQIAAGYNISFNGEQIYSTQNENQRKDQLRKTINAYNAMQNALPSMLLNKDNRIFDLQAIRQMALQSVQGGGNREGINDAIKAKLEEAGISYSEEYANSLVDLFTQDKLDFRDLFKGGALLDDNALDLVKTSLANYGIDYTGSLSEFLIRTAEQVFSASADFIEETYQEYDTPDLKGIRNHFQAQSKNTYNTWKSKNQTAINATEVIKLINNNNLNSVQSLFDYMNNNDVGMWDALSADEELAPLLLGISRDQKTGQITAPKTLMQDIMARLYTLSSEYGDKAYTNTERIARVRDAINNISNNGYFSSYSSMEAARDEAYKAWEEQYRKTRDADIGTKEDIGAGKRYAQEADYQAALAAYTKPYLTSDEFTSSLWKDENGNSRLTQFISAQDIALLQGYVGNNLANKILNKESLSNLESQYVENILANASLGISGLTKQQKLEGARSLEGRKSFIENNYDIAKSFLEGFDQADIYLAALQTIPQQRTDEQKKAIEAYDNWYKEQSEKYNFKFSEDKNASKLLQNYITWTEGSLTERMGIVQPYIQQQRNLANAQAILNGSMSTAENRNALASIVGLEDQDIKDMVKSDKGKQDLQKMLNDKTGKMIEEFAKSFDINLGDANWADQLRAKVLAEQPELYDSIDSLVSSITNLVTDAEGHVISANVAAQRTTQAGDYYKQAEEDYEKQTRTARAASWINQYQNEINQLVGTESDIFYDSTGRHSKQRNYSDALNIIAERYNLDQEIMAEYWTTTRAGLNKSAPELLQLYDNAQISGGKYKSDLDNALFGRLFEGTFVNGKLDTTQIDKIKEQMISATEDTESGTYTLWSILASDVTQLADAFQLLKDEKPEEAINALNKAFEEMSGDRIDELLKYVDVSKDFKDALTDLAKGGTKAAAALAKLNAQNEEDYNAMLSAFKVQKKDGTYKAGKDITGKDKTNFLELTGLTAQQLRGMSSEEVQRAAEAGLNTRAERIQTEKVAMIKSASEQLDFSKITFDAKGKMDISKATEGLSEEAVRYWKDVETNINDLVGQKGLTISVPALFKLAGYEFDEKSIKDMVKSDEYKKMQETFMDAMNSLSGLSKNDLSKITLNADLTFDTTNLAGQQKVLVNKWNKIAKDNPFYANLVVSSSKATATSSTGGQSGITVEGIMEEMKKDENWEEKYKAAVAYHELTGDYAYGQKYSGGGGGKSALQKLLEKQERELIPIQHENKMLEIQEKQYDYNNDYTGWKQNINDQISGTQKLVDTQKEHIKQLEEERAKKKEDSDEWWNLTKQINSNTESLAENENQLNELSKKRLEVIQQEMEERAKPGTHISSMLEQYAERALATDRFADYARFTQQRIDEKQAESMLHRGNIETIKQEMADAGITQYDENGNETDNWRQYRDLIRDEELAAATADTEYVQMQQEFNQQRLSQVAKILQYNTQTTNHNNNIASAYANSYNSGGYRDQYENMLHSQFKAAGATIEANKEAEASARAQMETLDEGTTEWYEAQAAVYGYQEAVAQATISQLELGRAIVESDIAGVAEDYTDATREISHVNDLLKTQAQEFLDTKDYKGYFEAIGQINDNLNYDIAAKQEKLTGYQTIYNAGMAAGNLTPAEQRELLDLINESETDVQNAILEKRQLERQGAKVQVDKLLEDQDWTASEYNHNIQLLGYQNSVYQNNGELTNVDRMLTAENELREDRIKELENERLALEEQLKVVDSGSEEEKRLTEAIKKNEEATASETASIDKNNKAKEENEKKILSLRKALQDSIDKEIEAEKKHQREMLSATVTTQDTILNVLKDRYKYEQELRKKDLEKEKESLNEYKKLINERFNYRKKAASQADTEEDLAELRRQLALIEADPTRSKDAKELRKKIADAEKELSWTIAEGELEAENERIDEQVEGIDRFIQYDEETTAEYLKNANNFAAEVKKIYEGTYQDLEDFMYEMNESFINSLPAAQKQLLQGWQDTWKVAKDIRDNNFGQIAEILGIYDSEGNLNKTYDELIAGDYRSKYLNYMKSTNLEYKDSIANNDQTTANKIIQEWEDIWDDWLKSIKNDAEYVKDSHTLGEVVSKVDELKDNIFKVNIIGIEGYAQNPYGYDYSNVTYKDLSNGEQLIIDNLNNLYKPVETIQQDTDTMQEDLSDINEAITGTKRSPDTKQEDKTYYVKIDGMGEVMQTASSAEEAAKKAGAQAGEDYGYSVYTKSKDKNGNETSNEVLRVESLANQKQIGKNVANTIVSIANTIGEWFSSLFHNDNGGLVNYTGLTWVDGTKARPESFLDATDTALLRSMLDSYNKIQYLPSMSRIDTSAYGNNTTVGDINITINQAELKSDADVDKLAKQVGQAFTKQLQQNGLNLSGYAF